jgi:hypothetical protein
MGLGVGGYLDSRGVVAFCCHNCHDVCFIFSIVNQFNTANVQRSAYSLALGEAGAICGFAAV